MKRVTSFKAQYRQAPARAATPPPPVWEPLSPILRPLEPSTTNPAGGNRTEATQGSTYANGGAINTAPTGDSARAPLQLSSLAVTYGPPLRSAPPPHTLPPYSLSLGSPIEALADAALTSQRTSPAFAGPLRRASHAATSLPTITHPISDRAPKQTFARDATYSYGERPAKRARSEYHMSPPYGQDQSRPATSHIPGWSYNVEQMADSGMRMHQDNRIAAPQQTNGGDKMVSDAELLLFFSNVSAHTAQSPPATAKRWSVSQTTPAELPPQQTRQAREPSSPQTVTTNITSPQHQRKQEPLDTKPPPELPSNPPDVPEVVAASQTQTPPEETVSAVSQAPVQETGPAEDLKSKKHQGWPKGKSRGPRSTPSASKRKRSTPKPKNASSTSTSAGSDQLQSPQSFSAEQPVPMGSNAPSSMPHRIEQPHPASPHNRRHSFSTSVAQPPSDVAPPASLRARSVPLGGEPAITAPADDLRQPTKKTAVVEQPDLICAACKLSESEVKVGDGEQWIGCDGCKEWYHYACAGFNSEREVRDVNKFYCDPCRPKFGETTSRSTDAKRRYNSNLAQRFASPSESTRRLTTPVSMKVSSRLPTTTPSITTSPLSRMET
jgi:F-box/leucine-rich repeat protein 10/11